MYSNRTQMKEKRKYVKQAIKNGIDLMDNTDLTHEIVSMWLEYAEEVIKLCVVDDARSNAYVLFLELKVGIEPNKKIPPINRLRAYVDFLFEVYQAYELLIS